MNKILISVKINSDIHQKLKEHKEKNGVPITFTIEEAVKEYLKKKGV